VIQTRQAGLWSFGLSTPGDLNPMSRPRLTIVCPVYNEEQAIPLFFGRVHPVTEQLSSAYDVDLLFINNASTDRTYEVIQALRKDHPDVHIVTLSSNVGYQRSVECGLRTSPSELTAFIDVDCEDPPEMIADFVRFHEQGFDIVYGERVDRDEARLINLIRKLFYHIVRRLADEDIILYMAEFCLLTSEVRDAVLADHNSFPFIRSSIARVGFNRLGIPYKRGRRIAGQTHYNLVGMTIFAAASVLSSSTLALRVPVYSLPLWLLATGLLGALQIMTGNYWLLLVNVLLAATYLGGTLAFLALYVARIYKNGLGRPNYIIHRRYTHLPPAWHES
jgi:dolichol-phosphate mannosyltransferase